MARSSFTPGDSNTPWWYETPSLASQSTFGQSSFTGASISQLTDPFSLTSDTTTNESSNGGSDDEGSDEEPRSFLISTVESDTGQSSFSLSSDFDNTVRQKQYGSARQPSNSISGKSRNGLPLQSRTYSDSISHSSRDSVPHNTRVTSIQQANSSTVAKKDSSLLRMKNNGGASLSRTNDSASNADLGSDWMTRERSNSGRGSGRGKEIPGLRREGNASSSFNQLIHPHTKSSSATTHPSTPPSSLTTNGSQGVVNFTVNCSIHLHPENGEVKRSNSTLELEPAPGGKYTITDVAMLGRDPMDLTHHSTITEEETTDLSGLLNPDTLGAIDLASEGSDRLTPISLSSDCSGESQLSHSMSSANQDILNYLRPQLMQYLNTTVLVPLLTQRNLLTKEDLKYLKSSKRNDKEKRRRILASAPANDFDLFVECIVSEKSEPGHVYLARRMREAIEKKRNNPFKRLSSLRHKGRNISSTGKSSPKDKERRHSPRSSSTPSPSTPTRVTPRSSLTAATSKTPTTSSSKISASDVSYNPIVESLPRRMSREETDSFGYETFTLPRRSSNLEQDSRGSKPYSSARYASLNTGPRGNHSKRSKIARHGSFQGAADTKVHVTPMFRDPNKLSEENSDVLESLSHFQTTAFNYPPTSHPDRSHDSHPDFHPGSHDSHPRSHDSHPGSHDSHLGSHDSHYYSTIKDTFNSSTTNPQTNDQRHFEIIESGRDSQRKIKKASDPSPYLTIPEIVAEATEDSDDVPPPLSKKKRRPSLPGDSKNKYPSLPVGRFSSSATPREMTKRQQQQQQQQPSSPLRGNLDQNLLFSTAMDRHSSLRRESPKRAPGSTGIKRGMSLHGVMDSPSRHYPVTNYDGGYMPSALSPDSVSPRSPVSPDDDSVPPPVPIKQNRTHRRTQSYDTSQTGSDFMKLSFPNIHPSRSSNYKNLSLRRETPPSSMSNYSNSSTISEVPSHIPIISTQDSGITSTFDGRFRSASGYSLSSEVSSASKSRGGFSELGKETLAWKKFEWLQEKVRFKKTPDDIVFNSPTHYNQERVIVYSGTLYQHGRPKFLVLLTDMLLILKPKKKVSVLPGRLGSFLSSSQGPQIDWFSDLECIAKMPLMLHHLSVRSLSKRKEPQVLYLHYDDHSEMIQFTFHSVSKEAKDIWVDSLNSAIVACTKAQASTVLPIGNHIRKKPTSTSYTKLSLTIVEANNVAVEVDAKTRNHFCVVKLGDKTCKTPNVKAQCWPSWDYKFEFVDFALTETVWIEFFTERVTSPDEFLGCIDIQLMAVAQRLKVNMSQGVSTLQLKNQHLPLKNGKGTLTVDFELGWETKS